MMRNTCRWVGAVSPILFALPVMATQLTPVGSPELFERTQVRDVANLIDARHPTWVDAASRQTFMEVTSLKEQIEGITPVKPVWVTPFHH